MTPNAANDLDLFRSLGVEFLPSFHAGAFGVVARYDLPKLSYPASFSTAQLEVIMEKLNRNLRMNYEGCGYYGSCPSTDGITEGHMFVLFADEVFYDDYRNGSDVPAN